MQSILNMVTTINFPVLSGLVVIIILIVFLLGPRPDTTETISNDASKIGCNLDSYLANKEATFTDIRDGIAKEIIWADSSNKTRTKFAVVYIHGFSASKMETSPVSQNIASALNANLFLTRLSGHGRSSAAMTEPKMSDWLNDTVEAISIGERLGDRIILVTTSTGSTLATWVASQSKYVDKVAGIVLMAPNFGIQAAPTELLNMPWAETILPIIMGASRSFETLNEGHRKGWTYQYPSKAIFPMAALLRTVDDIDKSTIMVPALFIYSSKDGVMVPSKVDKVIQQWGGPTSLQMVEDSDDPNNHIIAGDILSPKTTKRVSDAIIKWIVSL